MENIRLSICSFSFHRLLEGGKQDIFQYILDSKELGATQLDPWNAHLPLLTANDEALKAVGDETQDHLSPEEIAHLGQVKAAAQKAGLPFGCIAVDGAHIYEDSEKARCLNRAVAYRWLQAAQLLGAPQIRIDAGGTDHVDEEAFAIIVEGFQDLIQRGQKQGTEILIENHWGPSPYADFIVRLMNSVDGLGLLFDTNNWRENKEAAWVACARYARAAHIKTYSFDENGNDPSVDIPKAIHLLVEAGYQGSWGVESVPMDGDEIAAVAKTFQLIKRTLKEI